MIVIRAVEKHLDRINARFKSIKELTDSGPWFIAG
jgi:hypothetical protein